MPTQKLRNGRAVTPLRKWMESITSAVAGVSAAVLITLFYHPSPVPVAERPNPEPEMESRISPYDPIIIRHARTFGVDWRLVASMISVESSFRHDAVSPRGALGLMQIMPVVALEQGAEFSTHPEKNIRTGVAHFTGNWRRLKGKTATDRIQLALAAYNVGLGHLRDAQNLAIESGLSPRSWDDVSRMLALLETPAYYEEAKYGYCQGSGAVEYVGRVMRQFEDYKSVYPKEPVAVTRNEADDPEPRT